MTMVAENPATVADLNYVPMDTALGTRISVIGSGGKSTLSKAIATKTGLAYIELDALHWKPNWEESSAEELKDKITAAIDAAPDGWIADGQYWSKIDDHLLREVDMVIWLDLPWRVGFWRMLKRSFRRAWDKNKICGDNTESWRKMLSRDSLWWYWVTHRKPIIERGVRLAQFMPEGTPVIRLGTSREQNRFYEVQGLTRAD